MTADTQEGMRFAVDGWDPTYGTSLEMEDDLGETTADVVTDIETANEKWAAIKVRSALRQPSEIVFVDGVRRVEARIWIDNIAGTQPASEASAALCASYAAGTVCCCPGSGAHLLTAEVRRGLFTVAGHAMDVATTAGTYRANHTKPDPAQGLAVTLSAALQRRLAEVELLTANNARTALVEHSETTDQDLLIIDGPLRGRQHLPRTLGFIKSHRTSYLPPELHALVGVLGAAERTPVFLMGTSWERFSWYLRLPCLPGAPWAGVVRLECSSDMPPSSAVALANISQTVLPRFASTEYKDSRAPQNLYPIAGLERQLRRRLGDPRLLYRALRKAAVA